MKILRTLSFLLLFACKTLSAQSTPTTGAPPFGSFGGGAFDVIDLSNLNIHFAIPVLHKHGRGVDFDFDITYDSSVWGVSGSSGSHSWGPANQMGWSYGHVGSTNAVSGSMTGDCGTQYPPPIGFVITGYTYGMLFQHIDRYNTPHLFPGTVAEEVASCATNGTYIYSGTPGLADDGSGHTGVIDTMGDFTVEVRIGKRVYWSNSGGQTSKLTTPYATDSNGNEVTTDNSGHYYDTLNSGTPVLTATGVAPNPTTFTYVAPSGGNASFTMKYTSYTVKTNFGCSGIAEYGPTAQYLVSEIDLPDGTSYTFTYEPTPGYSSDVTGRIASVKLPTGGTIDYSYSGANNGVTCADGTPVMLTRQTPDGSWYYDHAENGTAWETTITDPQLNETVMYFQGLYQTEAQIYQGSGTTLLKTIYTCYNGAAPSCNSSSITLPITQKATYVQWPGGSNLESETKTLYNSYGLVTEKDEYAYGSGAPGSLARKTLTSYASLGNNIVNRPYQVTIQDGSGNIKGQTTYTYDQGSISSTSGTPQHVSVSGSRGNATTVAQLVSGSSTLSKTFSYFDTGNVYVATDVNGAQTTYTYGACGNSFPTAFAEPLGLSKSMAWNCAGGIETSAKDESGNTTSSSYTDSYFWRPASTTDQLSNVMNMAYTGQTSVEGYMNFNGSSTADTLATLDSQGRSHIEQTRQAPGSSTFDSVETDYDADGRPYKTYVPYAGSAGQLCSGSCPATTTAYDALGRPLTVTDGGGGTTTYSYTGNDEYITAGPAPSGENTKRKQLEYDALGRLTSVCEVTSASGSGSCGQTNPVTGYFTTYTYDVLNNLTGVSQGFGAQSRSYTYDGLSRMTSEINPESGTTTYQYDTSSICWGGSNGDLTIRTDNAGNVTCFNYDKLHRLTDTSGWYNGYWYSGNGPCHRFRYDATGNGAVSPPSGSSPANLVGRMVEAETDICTAWPPTPITDEWFSYDARGETTDLWESTPHSGGYYHSNATYWANGALSQLSNQLGSSLLYYLTYGVDGEGRLYSTAGTGGTPTLTSTSYNSESLPTQLNFPSGDSDSYNYDPNTNRMTQYSFSVNGQSVVGQLSWNPLGTLAGLTVTDPFNSADSQICSYSHDDLARIASANCGGAASQTFSYDRFGNVSTSGSPYSFLPNYSSTTNQMTSIGGSTPSYDSDGDVLNDFLHTYSWNAYGRPITIDGVSVTYDATGRAVEQNNAGTYNQMVYSPTGFLMEIMNGSSYKNAFSPMPGGGETVWSASAGIFYYRHGDWLGSSRFASTPSRTVFYDGAYAPFGAPYAQTGTTDLFFTGMDQDTVANLYDFPAREYNPIQGRWPSPDPAGTSSMHLEDPQTLNRYAYVRNSPLTTSDPTGMDGCDSADDGEPCIPGMIGDPSEDGSIPGIGDSSWEPPSDLGGGDETVDPGSDGGVPMHIDQPTNPCILNPPGPPTVGAPNSQSSDCQAGGPVGLCMADASQQSCPDSLPGMSTYNPPANPAAGGITFGTTSIQQATGTKPTGINTDPYSYCCSGQVPGVGPGGQPILGPQTPPPSVAAAGLFSNSSSTPVSFTAGVVLTKTFQACIKQVLTSVKKGLGSTGFGQCMQGAMFGPMQMSVFGPSN